jgi:arylsulfatase A-like enzyme
LSRRAIRFPTVGIALGAGLLVAECVIWIRQSLDSFGGGGIWRALLEGLAIYVAAGAAIDLLVQALAPRRFATSPIARGLPLVALAFAAHWNLGMVPFMATFTIPVAIAWAFAAHVRWGLPLAVGMALFGLAPALPGAAVGMVSADLPDDWSDGPSFVIVVLDALRWDHSSLSGYSRDTTPNLAALAQRGVRFERAYATSCWSIPSHASLFTGLLPRHHGADFETLRLHDGAITLAWLLTARGYETVGFSANPYVASTTGLAQGFSRFEDLWRPTAMRTMLVSRQILARVAGARKDKGGAEVVASFERWHDERATRRPYFAFVNFMEPHAPYQDGPLGTKFADPDLPAGELSRIGDDAFKAGWLGTQLDERSRAVALDLLDGAAASADRYLGQILDIVGDEAVVVVLADHGELVGEHGLYGHHTGLYEQLIRIPMAMAGPGVPRGAVVEGMVSIVDVMPTVLAMAGAEVPKLDGIDLTPVLSGDLTLADRVVNAEHFRAIYPTQLWSRNRTAEEMRVIRARRGAAVGRSLKRVVSQDGTDYGYDLGSDPFEQRPFEGASTGYVASIPEMPDIHIRPVELDPEQIEALRSLGYVH